MKVSAAEKFLILLKNGLITERDCSLHTIQEKLPNKIIMIYVEKANVKNLNMAVLNHQSRLFFNPL